MDSETLREACEMAGMDVFPDPKWDYEHIISTPMGDASTRNPFQVEWIESRCADLLVGKVRERNRRNEFWRAMARIVRETEGPNADVTSWYWLHATTEQRLAAAMAVLEGATDE